MAEFYNPYHFVPVAPRSAAQKVLDLTREALQQGGHHVTHERYVPGTHSGRLTCTVTTETPLVIGAEQRTGEPTEVEPYRVDGRPAIPGSSLRGLLSSLTEAASNSALRVLENRPLSYRRAAEEALSAIGLLMGSHGSWRVLPLTLPYLRKHTLRGAWWIPKSFRPLCREHLPMRVEIGDRRSTLEAKQTRKDKQERRDRLAVLDKYPAWEITADSFLRGDQPAATWSPGSGQNQVWYIRGLPLQAAATDDAFLPATPTSIKAIGQDWCLGYSCPEADAGLLIPHSRWAQLRPNRQPSYVPGLIRRLGATSQRDLPATKLHELFLPIPGSFQKYCQDGQLRLPEDVAGWEATHAVTQFQQLADERWEATKDQDASEPVLPLEPLVTRPDRDRAQFMPCQGDLVYFRLVDDEADSPLVAEISYSAIWRGLAGTAHQYFRGVDRALVPLQRPSVGPLERPSLSIAEQMWGVVEEPERDLSNDRTSRVRQGPTSPARGALALASRVRVSDAELSPDHDGNVLLEAVTLRILDSPKPPSPALYFKKADGRTGYVAKPDLSPSEHHPQGRKMYLHHLVDDDQQPWRTADEEDRPHQKLSVTPIQRGAAFSFDIDFFNLSNRELGLLLYSILPDANFRHKLGLGKPLGLGSVKLQISAQLNVDRQKRYTLEGAVQKRYQPADWSSLLEDTRRWLDRDIHDAIVLLGSAAQPAAMIHVPTTIEATDSETKTYEWFQRNDKPTRGRSQSLQPLPQSGGHLPTLEEN